jgi:hypothetical protein
MLPPHQWVQKDLTVQQELSCEGLFMNTVEFNFPDIFQREIFPAVFDFSISTNRGILWHII